VDTRIWARKMISKWHNFVYLLLTNERHWQLAVLS
jgi:hypothetical protein